jgi:hypothetical protein
MYASARLSRRKLQRPLDPLETRHLTQRIKQGVDFQIHQTRVTQPQCRFQPLERFGSISPLRINFGVLICPIVAQRGLQSGEHGFSIGMPPEPSGRSRMPGIGLFTRKRRGNFVCPLG